MWLLILLLLLTAEVHELSMQFGEFDHLYNSRQHIYLYFILKD